MRTTRAAPANRFLGVRLTPEEASLLERFRTDQDLKTRSAAVRALVRGVGTPSDSAVEIPVTLRNELEELVEDGYARDMEGAVALVLTLGIRELARTHTEHVPSLRDRARSAHERRATRHRVDREGRGLLGR